MRAGEWTYSTSFADHPSRDTIDGLSAIAAALDDGLGGAQDTGGSKLLDTIAILCGWAVLIVVIMYPAIQLAAIAACSLFMLGRALLRPRAPRAYSGAEVALGWR